MMINRYVPLCAFAFTKLIFVNIIFILSLCACYIWNN